MYLKRSGRFVLHINATKGYNCPTNYSNIFLSHGNNFICQMCTIIFYLKTLFNNYILQLSQTIFIHYIALDQYQFLEIKGVPCSVIVASSVIKCTSVYDVSSMEKQFCFLVRNRQHRKQKPCENLFEISLKGSRLDLFTNSEVLFQKCRRHVFTLLLRSALVFVRMPQSMWNTSRLHTKTIQCFIHIPIICLTTVTVHRLTITV